MLPKHLIETIEQEYNLVPFFGIEYEGDSGVLVFAAELSAIARLDELARMLKRRSNTIDAVVHLYRRHALFEWSWVDEREPEVC